MAPKSGVVVVAVDCFASANRGFCAENAAGGMATVGALFTLKAPGDPAAAAKPEKLVNGVAAPKVAEADVTPGAAALVVVGAGPKAGAMLVDVATGPKPVTAAAMPLVVGAVNVAPKPAVAVVAADVLGREKAGEAAAFAGAAPWLPKAGIETLVGAKIGAVLVDVATGPNPASGVANEVGLPKPVVAAVVEEVLGTAPKPAKVGGAAATEVGLDTAPKPVKAGGVAAVEDAIPTPPNRGGAVPGCGALNTGTLPGAGLRTAKPPNPPGAAGPSDGVVLAGELPKAPKPEGEVPKLKGAVTLGPGRGASAADEAAEADEVSVCQQWDT